MRLFQPIPRLQYVCLALASFVVFLIGWSLLSRSMESAKVFLPPPWEVLTDGWEMIRDQSFQHDIFASVWRVTVGFVLAVVVAVPLGIAAGAYRSVDAVVQPFNDFVRYMPVAAFVPLTILWLGIGDSQKMIIIFLGTVFQLVPLVTDTVNMVPRHLVDLGYTMGCRPWQVVLRVIVPWSMPIVYDHCRVALGWAWSYLVIAELVAAPSGIGHVIIQSQRFIQTGKVMAGIMTIGIIGLVFDQMFRLPKRFIFRWL